MFVIDPGHGGSEFAGRSSPLGQRFSGRVERDVTLAVARAVQARMGGRVRLTRERDVNLSLRDRAEVARGAEAFVSVHAHGGAMAVYVGPAADSRSRALAEAVSTALGAPVETCDLAVLAYGHRAPGCVVDVGAGPDAARVGGAIADALWNFAADGSWSPVRGTHDTSDIEGFRAWVLGLVPDARGDHGADAARAARATLDRLWANLPGRWPAHHELIAWSVVRRARDVAMAPAPTPAPHALADRRLTHLARRHWWKLFVDAADQGRAGGTDDNKALYYDNDASPGFYGSMMAALEQWVLPAGPPFANLTWAAYKAMHDSVVANVRRKSGDDWAKIPSAPAGEGVTYGISAFAHDNTQAHPVPPNPVSVAGLRDLIATGIACPHPADIIRLTPAPHPLPASSLERGVVQCAADVVAAHAIPVANHGETAHELEERYGLALAAHYNTMFRLQSWPADAAVADPQGGRKKLGGLTVTADDRLQGRVTAILGVANAVLGAHPAPGAAARTTAIARCVRDLHVSHVFSDANGRLNTRILLLRALQVNDLQPTVIGDPSIFGGRCDVAQLVAAITAGQGVFEAL